MKKYLSHILIAVASLFFTACQSGPKTAEVTALGSAQMGYLVEGWYNADGSFTGSDLQKKSASSKYKFAVSYLAGREVDGYKKAQLTIENETKSFISLQYRFFWYDGEGIEIESDSTAWHPLHLSGKLSRTIQSVARKPGATHFKVYVRELK